MENNSMVERARRWFSIPLFFTFCSTTVFATTILPYKVLVEDPNLVLPEGVVTAANGKQYLIHDWIAEAGGCPSTAGLPCDIYLTDWKSNERQSISSRVSHPCDIRHHGHVIDGRYITFRCEKGGENYLYDFKNEKMTRLGIDTDTEGMAFPDSSNKVGLIVEKYNLGVFKDTYYSFDSDSGTLTQKGEFSGNTNSSPQATHVLEGPPNLITLSHSTMIFSLNEWVVGLPPSRNHYLYRTSPSAAALEVMLVQKNGQTWNPMKGDFIVVYSSEPSPQAFILSDFSKPQIKSVKVQYPRAIKPILVSQDGASFVSFDWDPTSFYISKVLRTNVETGETAVILDVSKLEGTKAFYARNPREIRTTFSTDTVPLVLVQPQRGFAYASLSFNGDFNTSPYFMDVAEVEDPSHRPYAAIVDINDHFVVLKYQRPNDLIAAVKYRKFSLTNPNDNNTLLDYPEITSIWADRIYSDSYLAWSRTGDGLWFADFATQQSYQVEIPPSVRNPQRIFQYPGTGKTFFILYQPKEDKYALAVGELP